MFTPNPQCFYTCFLSCLLLFSSTQQALAFSWDPVSSPHQHWAETFAPELIHDSQEVSFVTTPDAQLQQGMSLKGLCQGQQQQLPVNSLDFWSGVASRFQHCQELALHFDKRVAPAQPVSYYHVLENGLYVYLQYWFFYSWNDTQHFGPGLVQQCGNHEGDWEHISLRLDRQKLLAAQSSEDYAAAIEDIYFAQHNRPQRVENKYVRPQDPRLRFNGSHLQVFVARGSHASLPWPGHWPLFHLLGMNITDSNDGQGLRLQMSELKPIQQEVWFGFPGRWGAVQHDSCDWLEQVSSASNDGSFGPGHAHKVDSFYQGDWFDFRRPWQGAGL